jgi:hypothetical protein
MTDIIDVAATEVAVSAATHAMVSHPIMRHLAGDVAGVESQLDA